MIIRLTSVKFCLEDKIRATFFVLVRYWYLLQRHLGEPLTFNTVQMLPAYFFLVLEKNRVQRHHVKARKLLLRPYAWRARSSRAYGGAPVYRGPFFLLMGPTSYIEQGIRVFLPMWNFVVVAFLSPPRPTYG